jgi:hypothetical protein
MPKTRRIDGPIGLATINYLGDAWSFRMIHVPSRLEGRITLLLCLFLSCVATRAQTFDFLPEADLYYRIAPSVRLGFQAKETREAGDPTQAEIGPSLDFSLKPLLRLKRVTLFDLDEFKSRPLQLSAGFRYVPSAGKSTVWRMELIATPHVPLVARILLTDRNRADLDWSNNEFTWRYRNRLELERSVTIHSYHPSPYVAVEPFYQSQYHKWSTTALYAGCLFSVRKHVELNPYYEHQNITNKQPNQQLNQLGVILNLFF